MSFSWRLKKGIEESGMRRTKKKEWKKETAEELISEGLKYWKHIWPLDLLITDLNLPGIIIRSHCSPYTNNALRHNPKPRLKHQISCVIIGQPLLLSLTPHMGPISIFPQSLSEVIFSHHYSLHDSHNTIVTLCSPHLLTHLTHLTQ